MRIAKLYTNEQNETKAMSSLLKKTQEPDQWHGAIQFPQIESNETAYRRCTDNKSAKRFCPIRWRSMENWKNVGEKNTMLFFNSSPQFSRLPCFFK